jgi:hypothetical protein
MPLIFEVKEEQENTILCFMPNGYFQANQWVDFPGSEGDRADLVLIKRLRSLSCTQTGENFYEQSAVLASLIKKLNNIGIVYTVFKKVVPYFVDKFGQPGQEAKLSNAIQRIGFYQIKNIVDEQDPVQLKKQKEFLLSLFDDRQFEAEKLKFKEDLLEVINKSIVMIAAYADKYLIADQVGRKEIDIKMKKELYQLIFEHFEALDEAAYLEFFHAPNISNHPNKDLKKYVERCCGMALLSAHNYPKRYNRL